MIDPIVQVSPYIANASVELLSSVISPIAAFTTATLPFKAPEMERMKIIVQKFVARPLDPYVSKSTVVRMMMGEIQE
jgi:hypothetical protein